MGRPPYTLVNDSNVDWNQGLPQVENFVRGRGLKSVLLDEYGFSDPTPYVPRPGAGTASKPRRPMGNQWAVVTANYLVDSRNCVWLMQYPHESLAGGSMYAVQLPPVIPAAGQPGGPPLPADYHYLGGNPGFDPLEIFGNCVRDPQQLQPTVDRLQAMFQEEMNKRK